MSSRHQGVPTRIDGVYVQWACLVCCSESVAINTCIHYAEDAEFGVPTFFMHAAYLMRCSESVAINSSLMTLARCLEVLRYNQQHPADQKVIPYRESKVRGVLLVAGVLNFWGVRIVGSVQWHFSLMPSLHNQVAPHALAANTYELTADFGGGTMLVSAGSETLPWNMLQCCNCCSACLVGSELHVAFARCIL